MKLTWHILRKDLRQAAVPGMVWLGMVLAAAIAFRTQRPGMVEPGDPRPGFWYDIIGGWASGFMLLQVLTGYVLSGALVLQDPLVGTNAFWATRPISWRRMMAAKAVASVLGYVVAPTVLLCGFYLAAGASWPDLARAAVQVAVLTGLPALGAIAIASLSGSLAGFVSWTALLVGLWAATGLLLETVVGPSARLAHASTNPVIWVAFPVLMAGMLVMRFAVRHRAWAIGMFAVGLAAAGVARVANPTAAAPGVASARANAGAAAVVGELPPHSGAAVRRAGSITRIVGAGPADEDGYALFVEQRGFGPEAELRDRFFLLDRGTGHAVRAREIQSTSVWFNGQRLRWFRLVVPAAAVTDAAVVQIRTGAELQPEGQRDAATETK